MNIKTLKAFTTQDSGGALRAWAFGTIYSVDSTTGNAFISAGLAEEYTGAVAKPYGTKAITANGTVDVSAYASANVNVPNPSTGTLSITENGEANVTDYAKVSVNVPNPSTGTKDITENGTADVKDFASVSVNVTVVTLTYDANGGTGSVDPEVVGKGTAVTLDDGTGLTAPDTKEFAGWATTNDAETSDVESPLTVTEDVTIYAVWASAE